MCYRARPPYVRAELDQKGVRWEESSDLLSVASEVDVLYQTRIQKERFGDRIDDYNAARGKYVVDAAVMDALPKSSIVMHPLPRLDEITTVGNGDIRGG